MTPRGGARKGAGRPAIKDESQRKRTRRQFAIWLPPDLADWSLSEAKAQGYRSRSDLVVQALDALRAAGTEAPGPRQHHAAPDEPQAPGGQADEDLQLAGAVRALVAVWRPQMNCQGEAQPMPVWDDNLRTVRRLAVDHAVEEHVALNELARRGREVARLAGGTDW